MYVNLNDSTYIIQVMTSTDATFAVFVHPTNNSSICILTASPSISINFIVPSYGFKMMP